MKESLSETLTSAEYRKRVFPTKDSSGKSRFSHLRKLVSIMFSFPFSNASVERLFGRIKLVKTDNRACLKQESLLALIRSKKTISK